jgi:light-regulated signal transduction histidine kinase (bacteriophytochrome)
MSVRSTLSISIVIDNDLWGLIACHGYGDAGIRVSLPIRELCRNIVSQNQQYFLKFEKFTLH